MGKNWLLSDFVSFLALPFRACMVHLNSPRGSRSRFIFFFFTFLHHVSVLGDALYVVYPYPLLSPAGGLRKLAGIFLICCCEMV